MSAVARPAVEAPAGSVPTRRLDRRAVIALVVLAAAAGAAALVLAAPFRGSGTSGSGVADNEYPTSLAAVERRQVQSETQVSATLGYAGAATISAPGGTAPSSVQQAQQEVATAQAQLDSARATQATDAAALADARATLSADTAKRAVDCRGDNAAAGVASSSSEGGGDPCSTATQAVATDRQTTTEAEAKVESDARAVAAAQTSLAAAKATLATAESSATAYGQGSTYTMLPAVGRIVRRGQALYSVDGAPVVLLYGTVTPYRAFAAGMSPGRDVAELNANLEALGYGHGLSGDAFTSGTAAAIDSFQAARGLDQTGSLALGSVVFERGPVRVTSVTPTRGSAVQAGPVLDITTTARQVTIALDASQQSAVRVGDPVTITLPDNSTTPGRVSYVGTVATTPSSDGGGGDSTPTIEVDVTPTDPAATGTLDQAPVQVSIVTASVRNALVVPVNALLALAGGGYAVEVVGAGGAHHLVAVTLGLFDDAEGLVQVTGKGLHPGQQVVIPAV